MSNSTSITASSAQDSGQDNVLYMEEYTPWFLPALIIVFPLMPICWKYHVKITEDEFSFGYSSIFTSKRVKNRKAVVVKEAKPLFDQKWAGWGIHYRPDDNNFRNFFERWERLYICKNGGAVKVILDETGNGETTTFYFSSENPQKVCDILNKKV